MAKTEKIVRPTRYGGNGVAPLRQSLMPDSAERCQRVNENRGRIWEEQRYCISCEHHWTGALDSFCPACGSEFTVASDPAETGQTLVDWLIVILGSALAVGIIGRWCWVEFLADKVVK